MALSNIRIPRIRRIPIAGTTAWKRKSARARATLALVLGICSLGAFGTATASADVFTTPYWGMTCQTFTSSSHGSASCSGAGKWRVAVSCNYGLTYRSGWAIQYESWHTNLLSAGSCWWGVKSVSVEEGFA
jgi:hypothetical protein